MARKLLLNSGAGQSTGCELGVRLLALARPVSTAHASCDRHPQINCLFLIYSAWGNAYFRTMANETPLLIWSELEYLKHGTDSPVAETATRKTRRSVLRVGEHTNDTPKTIKVVWRQPTAYLKKGVNWCGHDVSLLHAHTCQQCTRNFYVCRRCEWSFLCNHGKL